MRYILMLAVAFVGCSTESPDMDKLTAMHAHGLALAVHAKPDPLPAPDEKCIRCGGTGWITHGDGHKTPCPDCSDGDMPTGWIWSDAKALIAKGNRLADWGLQLQQAAETAGKIRLDVHLPTDTAPAKVTFVDVPPMPAIPKISPPVSSCPSGVCPVARQYPAKPTTRTYQPTYRRGLFGRLRR